MQYREFVTSSSEIWKIAPIPVLAICLWLGVAIQAIAEESLSFKLGLLAEISSNKNISDFYEERDFAPIWIDSSVESAERRAALLKALAAVSLHALPEQKYGRDALVEGLYSVRTMSELGALEAMFTRAYLSYANDVHSGVLKPSSVNELIARKTKYRSVQDYLSGAASQDAVEFLCAVLLYLHHQIEL